MKKFPISLLCGAATIIVTILLYFVILNSIVWEAIHFITLVGVVIAEAITTAYAFLSKGDPRRVAATVVSALTVPMAILLSVVYIVSFPTGYVTYACLYLVGLIIANVISLILCRFSQQ